MIRRHFTFALLTCLIIPAALVDGGDELGVSDCPCNAEGLWTRTKLTGDWLGYRSSVAGHGFNLDVPVTQFYQGVTSGGANETFRYGGKADYFLTYSGQQAGLPGLGQGLLIALHAETRFGEDINQDAVTLAPPNTNMLYPSGDRQTAITGLTITQALSEEWAVSIGKFTLWISFNRSTPKTVAASMAS